MGTGIPKTKMPSVGSVGKLPGVGAASTALNMSNAGAKALTGTKSAPAAASSQTMADKQAAAKERAAALKQKMETAKTNATQNQAQADATAQPSSISVSTYLPNATPTEKMVLPGSPAAAVKSPALAPVAATDTGLRDAYKAVFGQQTANVDRQNALRSGAANRQAAETAAIGGYNAAQTARAQELASAQANSANLEAQQNLLNTGTELAQAQQNADDDKIAALLEQYGESSPELLAAVAKSYATGQNADFGNVFNADGTVKTLSSAQKEMASMQDYIDVLNDPEAPEALKATIQAKLDSTYSTSKASSATASTQDVATFLKTGTKGYNDFSESQVRQAAVEDPSVLDVLKSSATKYEDRNSAMNAKVGSVALVDGAPVEILGRPYIEQSKNGDGYWVYADVYNYDTGEKKKAVLFEKDSSTSSNLGRNLTAWSDIFK